jgi:uncharacterized protein
VKTEVRLSPAAGLASLFCLLAFAAAEILIRYSAPAAGVGLYFMVLLVLLVFSATPDKSDQRPFFMTMALVPLIRIASLTLPIVQLSEIYWYLIIAVPVLVGALIVMRSLKLTWADIGINGNNAPVQVAVAAIGIGLGLVDYLILKPDALNPTPGILAAVFPAVVLLLTTGFLEELVFRGLIQRESAVLGSEGWVFVALFYAQIQVSRGSPLHVLLALAVGLLYGLVVKKTGSIVGVSVSHGLMNIAMLLVFPHVL